ncbi:MAG TPA: transposase [Bacillota bacterium]|nr:transposase [Bacillota bacterium]
MNPNPIMPEKFKNKYRIASARLQSWDYRSNGAYFITICTAGRKNYFGSVKNREMVLTPIGRVAHEFWMEIPSHFPFVVLDALVVMPNHTHGIVIIDRGNQRFRDIRGMGEIDRTVEIDRNRRDVACNVSTITINFTKTTSNPAKNQFMSHISPKSGSISTIVRSFKSAVTRQAREIDGKFVWQERFHDHIIRDHEEFLRIQRYIINNPASWE